ncbi:acyl-ACP desaturase [Bacillus cereus]|nr:acyl-ACP desaturase [Bacillus cereus]
MNIHGKKKGGTYLLTNDLDFRLESRLKELYEQHKIRAQKIDWGYIKEYMN